MRLGFVVQRYGNEITGGAELHARLIAEHLAPRHDITVLTTCAQNYVTWENEYAAGVEDVGGVPVMRFPVRRPRDPQKFGRLQEQVFRRGHTERQALAWMDAQGPQTPRLLRWLRRNESAFDYLICFSYRYWTTFKAVQALPRKSLLVPTAEPDPTIELPIFRSVFESARALMHNSHEERQMIRRHSDCAEVPNVIVGVGIVDPPLVDPAAFRQQHGLEEPFLLYIGRIDANKGCQQLFDNYLRAHAALTQAGQPVPRLVLAGSAILDIPEHPDIVYLGRVDEQTKYDALAACTALVMPSFYESLSMVLLEAWALSRPVLVNAHCDVLQGQARRSNGGLWYHDLAEFKECIGLLSADTTLGERLGRAGHRYYDEHYTWPVIEDKYETMLERLAAEDA